MECDDDRIKALPTVFLPKTTLMLSQIWLSRCIILGFMVLIGYSIAKSIQAGSPLGLILAIISLCAAVYFIHLMKKLGEERV